MPPFHSLSSNRALLIASRGAGIAMWRRPRRGPLLTKQAGCVVRKRVTRERYLGGGERKERGGTSNQCQLSSANCCKGSRQQQYKCREIHTYVHTYTSLHTTQHTHTHAHRPRCDSSTTNAGRALHRERLHIHTYVYTLVCMYMCMYICMQHIQYVHTYMAALHITHTRPQTSM